MYIEWLHMTDISHRCVLSLPFFFFKFLGLYRSSCTGGPQNTNQDLFCTFQVQNFTMVHMIMSCMDLHKHAEVQRALGAQARLQGLCENIISI